MMKVAVLYRVLILNMVYILVLIPPAMILIYRSHSLLNHASFKYNYYKYRYPFKDLLV